MNTLVLLERPLNSMEIKYDQVWRPTKVFAKAAKMGLICTVETAHYGSVNGPIGLKIENKTLWMDNKYILEAQLNCFYGSYKNSASWHKNTVSWKYKTLKREEAVAVIE